MMTIDEILELIASHELTSDEGLAMIESQLRPSTRMYDEIWIPAPCAAELSEDATVLLFGSDELARSLGDDLRVITVRKGERFEGRSDRYAIRPDARDDYRELFEHLHTESAEIDAVVYAWSEGTFTSDIATIAAAQTATWRNLTALSGELAKRSERPGHILLVERQTADPLEPQSRALLGFVRTVRRELTGTIVTSVAVDPAEDLSPIVRRELAERAHTDVRYAPERQTVAFREHELAEGSAPGESLCRDGAVVLITGGAGGLGRLIAEHLRASRNAKVVLCGRSPEPPFVRDLEDVVYVEADVSEEEGARRAVDATRSHFGRIDGVIHAAGVIRDARLVDKSAAELDEVAGPKVRGAILLDDLLRDEPLDFFVMFSAAAATLGNAGQADYAWANGFLSDISRWREGMRRQGLRSGRTISIAWPLWESGGMQLAEPVREALRKATGLVAMPTDDGLAAFDRIMVEAPVVVVPEAEVPVAEAPAAEAPAAEAPAAEAAAPECGRVLRRSVSGW